MRPRTSDLEADSLREERSFSCCLSILVIFIKHAQPRGGKRKSHAVREERDSTGTDQRWNPDIKVSGGIEEEKLDDVEC